MYLLQSLICKIYQICSISFHIFVKTLSIFSWEKNGLFDEMTAFEKSNVSNCTGYVEMMQRSISPGKQSSCQIFKYFVVIRSISSYIFTYKYYEPKTLKRATLTVMYIYIITNMHLDT